MQFWQFDSIYTEQGWLDNAYVSVADDGTLIDTTCEKPTTQAMIKHEKAWLIPGFQNAHSHAFQYAMAGCAEYLANMNEDDDFWSWRHAMYDIALRIDPDMLQAIATQLYAEMLRHGYTSVVEFHYLHHDQQGKHYTNIAEMGCRLIEAAKTAGIAITLVPILYQQCDLQTAATKQQRRFLSTSLDDYWRLYNASELACADYTLANLGLGVHSIRAVAPQVIINLFKHYNKPTAIHLHIAEQQQEVEQAIDILGMRPVEWLLNHVELDQRFNLVHATHMNADETQQLARSQANVVLCPSTEGNLGDGFFPLIDYLKHQGHWSIGSDSQISLSPLEELRWLDYGQRLLCQQRNILCQNQVGNSGDIAFRQAYQGGRMAAGKTPQLFQSGECFSGLVINHQHPSLAIAKKEQRMAKIIYASDARIIDSVIVNGQYVVKQNQHYQHQEILQNYIDKNKALITSQ